MEVEESVALGGALELTELSAVVNTIAQDAYQGLKAAISPQPSATLTDEKRRKGLLVHLHNTRQRMLKLLVVSQWSNQARALVEVGNVLEKAAWHAASLRDAADQLYHQHNDPFLIRAPPHDVHTALDVLQTGEYKLLPLAIESLRKEPDAPPKKRAAAIQLMDQLLRVQLLKEELPPGLRVVSITDGAALVRKGDDFEAKLILIPAPPPPEEALQAREAAGGDGQEPQGADSSIKAEQGAVKVEESVAKVEALGVKAEAMDIDATGDGAKTGAGAFAQDGVGKGPGAEEWRWRIMSLTILPGEKQDVWMKPAQTAYLQQQTDQLMWLAADACQRRLLGLDKVDSGKEDDGPGGPDASGTSLAPASSTAESAVSGFAAMGMKREQPAGEAGGEPVRPLHLMQRALSLVAARIVVLESMRWASTQLEGKGQPWHGLVRREPGRILVGGRITYWLRVAVLAPEELHSLEIASSIAQGVVSTAPALEVGLDASQQLRVVHQPPLADVTPEGALGLPTQLSIRMHTADLEASILQAAAANANLQLAGLMRCMKAKGDIEANNGQLALVLTKEAHSRATAGSVRGYSSGVLEQRFSGSSLLCVSVDLKTGHLLLRPGQALQDSADVAVHLRAEEQKLVKIQGTPPPSQVRVSAAVYATQEASRTLEKLFLQLCLRQRLLSHTAAVTGHGLCHVPLPLKIYKEYLAAHPQGQRVTSKHNLLCSFPPPPPLLPMLPPGHPTVAAGPGVKSTTGSLPATPSPGSLSMGLSPGTGLTPPAGGASPGLMPDTPGASQAVEAAAGTAVPAKGGAEVRERAEWAAAMLGPTGCSLMFGLYSELKPGMRWEYMLMSMTCNALGQPVKVLNVRKVPLLTPKSASARPARGKRKREEEGDAQPPAAATAEDGSSHQAEAEDTNQNTATRRGSGPDNDLEAVLAWCREQAMLGQLTLHLELSGLPFSTAMLPVDSRKRRRKAPSLTERAAAAPANGVPSEAEDGTAHMEDGPPSGRLETRLIMDGLQGLKKLDGASGATAAGPQVELYIDPYWHPPKVGFGMEVTSSYLASLPPTPRDGPNPGPIGRNLASTARGLECHYPPGATAWDAVMELTCIVQLHTFLRGLQHPHPEPQGTTAAGQPSSNSTPASQWTFEGSGVVTLESVTLERATFKVSPAADWVVGSSQGINPQDRPSTAVQNGPLLGAPLGNGISHNAGGHGTGDILGALGHLPDLFSLASQELAESRGDGSNTFGHPGRGNQKVEGTQSTLHKGGGLPEVVLVLEWWPSSADGGRGGGRQTPRCRLTANPALPPKALQALEHLAEREGRHPKAFMEALSMCAAPLATIQAAVSPPALASCGLEPDHVRMLVGKTPLCCRLLMLMATERVLMVDCQFKPSSLVWTSLLLSPSTAAGPDPTPEKRLLEFCQGLLQVPGVSSSDKPQAPIGVPESGTRASLWCRAWAFPVVLQATMLFCAGGLQESLPVP